MKYANVYDVTIQQMETCIIAAKTGSFTSVSQSLFMTQSAVSKQIKSIEDKIGIIIFTRGRGTTLTLTPAGKELIKQWQDIVKLYNVSLLKAENTQMNKKNTFIIGTTPSSNNEAFILPIIREFEKKHSDISVHIELGAPEDLKNALTNGKINMIICNDFKKELFMVNEFDLVEIIRTPWMIGMKADNLLSSRTKLNWRDLRNQNFVAVNDYIYIKMLNGFCSTYGDFEPNISFTSSFFYGLCENVRDSKTVFLTDKFSTDYNKAGYKYFPMEKSISGQIMVTKASDVNPYVPEFVKFVKDYVTANNLSEIDFLDTDF